MYTKKYELVPEGNLFRIRAVKDFSNVKKGDLGGLVEDGLILSHKGDCWIYDNAKVYGMCRISENATIKDNAQVSGHAKISENARIEDNAQVSGYAQVFRNAIVYDNATISGNAHIMGFARISSNAIVYDNATISGKSEVSGSAKVFDNAKVGEKSKLSGKAKVFGNASLGGNTSATKEVITFGNAFCYNITVTDNHIGTQFEQYLKNEWLNFSEEEIIEIGGNKLLEFWKIFKPMAEQLGLFNSVN